jgi:hypothetical protein
MSTNSLVRAVKIKFSYFSLIKSKFSFLILPFNSVAKSATADLVLLNSVLVEAKVVIVVSRSFEVAEPFYLIKIQLVSGIKKKMVPLRSFFRFSSATFNSWSIRFEFTAQSKKTKFNLLIICCKH